MLALVALCAGASSVTCCDGGGNQLGAASSVFRIVTGTLADATVGSPYTALLRATKGTAPYINWSVTGGTIPAGLNIDPDTGVISGVPAAAESAVFTVEVTDSAVPVAHIASHEFTLTVGVAVSADFTGAAITGTDIWYIDISADGNGNGTADFDEALVQMGMDAARDLVIEEIMQTMWQAYGNNPDGTLNPTGAAISFTMVPPGGLIAAKVGRGAPSSRSYNVIPVVDNGTVSGAVGRATADGGNDHMENFGLYNVGRSQDEYLGIFTNRLVASTTGITFAQMFAICCAHEIGHAIGLSHNAVVEDTIMDATVSTFTQPVFSAAQYTAFEQLLPGHGR